MDQVLAIGGTIQGKGGTCHLGAKAPEGNASVQNEEQLQQLEPSVRVGEWRGLMVREVGQAAQISQGTCVLGGVCALPFWAPRETSSAHLSKGVQGLLQPPCRGLSDLLRKHGLGVKTC